MSRANDIYLGDVGSINPYIAKSVVADSAPQVAPRFSSGEQGQSDLDLLKSASVANVNGGMFQRQHIDNTRVARAIGVFNPYDQLLYPSPPKTNINTLVTGVPLSSWVFSFPISFISLSRNNGGTITNEIYGRRSSDSGWSRLTLPAGLASGAASSTLNVITDLVLHGGLLFVLCSNGHNWRVIYNTWPTISFTDIGGPLYIGSPMRGVFYGISTADKLYQVTNELTGTPVYTALIDVGDASYLPYFMKEFNGAIWIGKDDGLFRFDGVAAVKVLNQKCVRAETWKGAMYFEDGYWVSRFDGANIEKLFYFGPTEVVTSYAPSFAGLVICTNVGSPPSSTSYSVQDMPVVPSNWLRRMYLWDGSRLTLLSETAATANGGDSVWVVPSGHSYNEIVQDTRSTFTVNINEIKANNIYSSSVITAGSTGDVTSSEFDGGYPNIMKSLETIEVNVSDMNASDVITVKYQLHDGRTWGSWQTLGTITTATNNYLDVSGSTNKLFRRMRINVSWVLAAGSTFKYNNHSWRYTLQPRFRSRWQLTLELMGTSQLDANTGTSKNFITVPANTLTRQVRAAIKSKTPIYYLEPDYGQVKTTATNATTSFTFNGNITLQTDPYAEYPLVAIKNDAGTWEILQVLTVTYNSGTNDTTVVVKARGYLGVTAGAITAGNEFRPAYKVFINRLLRDAVILDPTTLDEQTTGESQLKREMVIEAIEA